MRSRSNTTAKVTPETFIVALLVKTKLSCCHTDVALYKTKTDHFTSFAVLFGVSPLDSTDCGWIWIACVVLAGE